MNLDGDRPQNIAAAQRALDAGAFLWDRMSGPEIDAAIEWMNMARSAPDVNSNLYRVSVFLEVGIRLSHEAAMLAEERRKGAA